jgi:hypothetical protein
LPRLLETHPGWGWPCCGDPSPARGDNIVITNKNPNNDVIAKHYKVKETKVVRNKEIKDQTLEVYKLINKVWVSSNATVTGTK